MNGRVCGKFIIIYLSSQNGKSFDVKRGFAAGLRAITVGLLFTRFVQARGPKKHLKRMFAPSHWKLDKNTGTRATRPNTGPHKLRECIPMAVLLRQRLKYALSGQEVKKICHDKELNIKVDGKARRDPKYPLGNMDVVEIVKTGEHFRMLYDLKGRFQPVRVDAKEANFKLCKVKNKVLGKNKIPYIVTHDGRTIRFPHPDIKKNDTVKVSVFLSRQFLANSIIINLHCSLT